MPSSRRNRAGRGRKDEGRGDEGIAPYKAYSVTVCRGPCVVARLQYVFSGVFGQPHRVAPTCAIRLSAWDTYESSTVKTVIDICRKRSIIINGICQ